MVLCGELEEDLRTMLGLFVEVYRRRGLKVNADETKVMVLNEEEGLECEVLVEEMRLEHVSKFKYLGYDLDESGIDEAECYRNMASERKGAGVMS